MRLILKKGKELEFMEVPKNFGLKLTDYDEDATVTVASYKNGNFTVRIYGKGSVLKHHYDSNTEEVWDSNDPNRGTDPWVLKHDSTKLDVEENKDV